MSHKQLEKQLKEKGVTINDLREEYNIKNRYVKKLYLLKKLKELNEIEEVEQIKISPKKKITREKFVKKTLDKLTNKDCTSFIKKSKNVKKGEKIKSPLTGRNITKGLGVYNKIVKKCEEYDIVEKVTLEKPAKRKSPKKKIVKKKFVKKTLDELTYKDCVSFIEKSKNVKECYKIKNPLTGGIIRKGRGIYNKIMEKCEQYDIVEKPVKRKSPKKKIVKIKFVKKTLDELTDKDCVSFIEESKNVKKGEKIKIPLTGSNITKGLGVYNKIVKKCEKYDVVKRSDLKKVILKTRSGKTLSTKKLLRKKTERFVTSPNIKDINYTMDDFDQKDTFVKNIGSGKFGKVELHILPDDTKVAIKIMNNEIDGEIESSTLTEIYVADRLKGCPTIIKFIDFQYTEKNSQMMMSYHTSDLLSFTQRVSLSERVKYFSDIMTQLIYGLYCLYIRGIIHADIKPQNILVDYELDENKELKYVPKVYYTDFGISVKLECDPTIRTYPKNDSLQTIDHRSFEILLSNNNFQLQGSGATIPVSFIQESEIEYNENIDIWALGVTLMEYLIIDSLFWYGTKSDNYPGDIEHNVMKNIFQNIDPPIPYSESYVEKYVKGEIKINGHINVKEILQNYNVYDKISDSTVEILEQMLQVNMKDRINIYDLVDLIKSEGYGTIYYSYDEMEENLNVPETKVKRGKKDMTLKIVPYKSNSYGILVNWMIDAVKLFKFSINIFISAIDMFDRYLIHNTVRIDELQLVGVTCLYIASKLLEVYQPQIIDFVYVTSNSYTIKQIIDTELKIIKSLNYELISCDIDVLLEEFQKLPKSIDKYDVLKKLNIKINRSISKYKYYNLKYDEISKILRQLVKFQNFKNT